MDRAVAAVAPSAIILRRLQPADLAAFLAIRADPDLGRYQGWRAMNAEAGAAFIAQMHGQLGLVKGEWWQVAIGLAGQDHLLGDIGMHLHEDGRILEIGFTLAQPWQGRGLAREAVGLAMDWVFSQSAVMQICACADARNLASIRLLEALGFQHVRSRNTRFQGEACVEQDYLIGREAWRGAGSEVLAARVQLR